jgi:hypothetical protein
MAQTRRGPAFPDPPRQYNSEYMDALLKSLRYELTLIHNPGDELVNRLRILNPPPDTNGLAQGDTWVGADGIVRMKNGGSGPPPPGGGVQLGGDIGGTETDPKVIGIQGYPVSSEAPADKDVLTWNAVDGWWEPEPASGFSYTLPPATASLLGGVKIGANIGVLPDGTISVAAPYTLSPATAALLGGVKIGANVSVAGDGTISVIAPVNADWLASSGLAQILNKPVIPAAQVNSDWNASSGVAMILNKPTIPGAYTLPPATASVLGGVKVGANVNVTVDGTISVAAPTAAYVLPVATSSVLGGVKQGSGVTIAGDGTLSTSGGGYTLPVATSSVLGGIKDGTGITVAADGTASWDTTQTPPVTFNGLVTANAGMTVKNNNPVGFFEPTNTFTQFQIICGSGGNFNLQWRPDSVTAFNNILSSSTSGAVTFAGPAALFNGTLTVNGVATATAGLTVQTSGNLDVWRPSLLRVVDGSSLWIYNQGNTLFGTIAFSGAGSVLIFNFPSCTYQFNQNATFSGNVTTTGAITVNNTATILTTAAAGNPSLRVYGNATSTPYLDIGYSGAFPYLLSSNGCILLSGNNALRFGTSTYGDTNDGRIVGNGVLGAPGLNIVGINSDNTGRKIGFWGTLTQVAAGPVANTLTATNFSAIVQANAGLVVTGATIDGYAGVRALSGSNNSAYSSDNSKLAYFNCDASGNMNILSTSAWLVAQNVQCSSLNCTGAGTIGNGATIGGTGIKFSAIGTTPHIHAFYWSGTLQAYVDGGSVGTITLTSERFMKEDIQAYGRGLDVIRQLKPVSYKYIPQPWRGLGQTHYGLIADEVEPVAPEMIELQTTMVEGEEKAVRFVDPRPMWFMLLNAVQELDKRLRKLEQRKAN